MGLAAEWQELSQRPPFALSDGELTSLLDDLFAHAARVSSRVLEALREADARGLAAAAGASSTGAWLRERERISAHAASRLVKLAAAVDGTATADALSEGLINVEQAGVIADAVAQVPAEHREVGEKLLLEQAATFGPRELGRLGERLVEVVDPEGAEQAEARRLDKAEQRAYAGRELNLTDVGAGRTRLTGWLDREGAAVVRSALEALCNPRIGAPADAVDPRSMTQRRADALVDTCRLALATGSLPDHGGDRPQLVLTMGWKNLRDQIGAALLDDGTTISPAAARRVACDAAVIPAVLGGAGQPLDVGRERRLFAGPLRRAVLLRDRGCGFPQCDRPARWCDVHHLKAWVDGGVTSLSNAVALCGHHHRVIHQGRWRVTMNAGDGHPDFWPPAHLGLPGPLRNKHHLRQ